MSFFPFLFTHHVGCKMALEGMFSLGSITGLCFHHESLDYDHFLSISSIFLICSFTFTYLKTLKMTFPPSIKGFQSLKGVWKHFIGSFHLCAHFLPFTVHFRFLNLKIPKIIFLFQSLNLPPYGFNLDLPLF